MKLLPKHGTLFWKIYLAYSHFLQLQLLHIHDHITAYATPFLMTDIFLLSGECLFKRARSGRILEMQTHDMNTTGHVPAGYIDMNQRLFSNQASAYQYHLEDIKKKFYQGVSLSFQPPTYSHSFCFSYTTHINSSQTDELWTEHRGVSEAAKRNHYTVEAELRDTWEFTNMSFLPGLLGVHCELLNLLHGKTPNVWQKMESWPLICLFER